MDRGERVVELVRDLGGQLTESCETFGTDDLIVQRAQLLDLCLKLLVEPRVLDCQTCALQEGLKRFVMLRRKRRLSRASYDHDAHRATIRRNRCATNTRELT